MSILSLAGNVISTTPFWGHWQLVNLDGSSQTEFEVQTPWNVALGSERPSEAVQHLNNLAGWAANERPGAVLDHLSHLHRIAA